MTCDCKHCVDYKQPERVRLRAELGLKELSSLDLHRQIQLNEMDAEFEFDRWNPRRIR